MTHSLSTLVLVPLIALLSPLLADAAGRWAPVPLVVFEIVFGILVGPDVLGWAHNDAFVQLISQFGLAMLFFMAGYEIDFDRLRGDPLRRSLLGWGMSVAMGVVLGLWLAPSASAGVIVGIALLVPLFLALLLLVRGVPSLLTAPPGTAGPERRALALFAATGLPLIVAITSIGVERGTLKTSTAAAMVGAGMLSVLVYPFLALKQTGGSRTPQGLQEAAESW